MNKVTNTEVKYRILIKSKNDCFKIGTILIKRLKGDIFYIPSQRVLVDSSCGIVENIINHISYHKNGQVHIKTKNRNRYILETGKRGVNSSNKLTRQSIKNIGFQEIVRDTIPDFLKLPKLLKQVDNFDVVFEVNKYKGPVQFLFSIVSGRLIVAKKVVKKELIKEISGNSILAGITRILGNKSGSDDKILQYLLFKYTGDQELSLGRNLFIPRDSKVNKNY